MILEILTPGKKIFSGEINLVRVPGKEGIFEIMNNHAAIISTLKNGKIKVIDNEGQIVFFDINGGVIEVLNNKVSILAEI